MKRLAVLSLLLLVLAACNTTNKSEPNENLANNNVNEIENNEENNENDKENNVNEESEADDLVNEDNNQASNTEEESTEDPQESSSKSESKEETPKTTVEKKDSPKKSEKKEDKPVEKDNPEQMLISMAEDIMKAQFDKDTDYLKSVISKGTKIEGNSFSFNNVTYPHQQDFFTKETASELSFRYPHKNSEESYIIGYAAVDKVNDYSFVIDFEFILENGEWKMNDMDVNK